MTRLARAVEVSNAAAGDAITASAYPDPAYQPNALSAHLTARLTAIADGHPADPVTPLLRQLLEEAAAFPPQQVTVPYLVAAVTRDGGQRVMSLADARGLLTQDGTRCWWRTHPTVPGHELLILWPTVTALFFKATAPASVQATWDGDFR